MLGKEKKGLRKVLCVQCSGATAGEERERETERDREKGWCVGFGERERWGNLESSVRALSPLKAGVCV